MKNRAKRFFCENMKFILGKKIKMSQVFKEDGEVVPVTLVEAGPCFVTQIKTEEKDGYKAVQVGFEKIEKEKKKRKSLKGKEFKYLKEFKVDDVSKFKIGQEIDVSVFSEGEKVSVSGISKGKGFQGGIKRWGFATRGRSHGVKHERRNIGSVGIENVSRVFKGKKMPGRMGGERVTVKNLEVVKVDKENNILYIKGALPGRRGTILEIKG